jgi:hypothetical protein
VAEDHLITIAGKIIIEVAEDHLITIAGKITT